MTILSAQSITSYCVGVPLSVAMIQPFMERTTHDPTGMTYGLGPCTYDVRIRQDLRLDRQVTFQLASTMERFVIPHNVCAMVMDKSTLARLGVSVQNTHIDPGWEGYLTLEISLHGPNPVDLPAGSPIAQLKFELLDHPTRLPYDGRYQHQPDRAVAAR